MGVITIYTAYFNTLDITKISSFEITSTVMIHETLHCFGFSSFAQSYFVNPTTNLILGSSNVAGTTTLRGKTVTYIKLAAVVAYA